MGTEDKRGLTCVIVLLRLEPQGAESLTFGEQALKLMSVNIETLVWGQSAPSLEAHCAISKL
jgi:hypothetical protein